MAHLVIFSAEERPERCHIWRARIAVKQNSGRITTGICLESVWSLSGVCLEYIRWPYIIRPLSLPASSWSSLEILYCSSSLMTFGMKERRFQDGCGVGPFRKEPLHLISHGQGWIQLRKGRRFKAMLQESAWRPNKNESIYAFPSATMARTQLSILCSLFQCSAIDPEIRKEFFAKMRTLVPSLVDLIMDEQTDLF